MTTDDLVQRLREEYVRLTRASLSRGDQDAALSALIADDAADRIEEMEEEIKRLKALLKRCEEYWIWHKPMPLDEIRAALKDTTHPETDNAG
jgi:hypothetical protein